MAQSTSFCSVFSSSDSTDPDTLSHESSAKSKMTQNDSFHGLYSSCNSANSQSVSRESSATPKPLDYRSESKRRATESETDPGSTEDTTLTSLPQNTQDTDAAEFVNPSNSVVDKTVSFGPKTDVSFGQPERISPAFNEMNGDSVPDNEVQEENNNTEMNIQSDNSTGSHYSGYMYEMSNFASSSKMTNPHPNHSRFYDPHFNVPRFYQDPHDDTAKKWWNERKESINAYLHEPTNEWTNPGLAIQHPSQNWSYGTFVDFSEDNMRPPHNVIDQYYHPLQCYSYRSYPSTSGRFYNSYKYGRYHGYRDHSNVYPKNKLRFQGSREFHSASSHDRAQHSINSKRFTHVTNGRDNMLHSVAKSVVSISKKKKSRKLTPSQLLTRPRSAGAVLMQSSHSVLSRLSQLSLNKRKSSKKESSDDTSKRSVTSLNSDRKEPPEDVNKKVLTAAANKLRRSFLAAKRTNRKDFPNGQVEDDESSYQDTQENAEDLSIPRPDSKIQSSAHLLAGCHVKECIGSGLRSTVPNISQRSETVSATEQPGVSRAPPMQMHPISLQLEDISEEEDENFIVPRRRHVSENGSESCFLPVKVLRSRSSSMCGLSDCHSEPKLVSPLKLLHRSPIQPRLDKMLIKQLLTMDKKSLQELVDDPKSCKVRHMVNQMMSEQRSVIAQRLDQLRNQASEQLLGVPVQRRHHSSHLSNHVPGQNRMTRTDQEEQELQILGHLEAVNLDMLSTDVLHQVRAILLAEQSGCSNLSLAQVSVSIDDLMSGEVGSAGSTAGKLDLQGHGEVHPANSTTDRHNHGNLQPAGSPADAQNAHGFSEVRPAGRSTDEQSAAHSCCDIQPASATATALNMRSAGKEQPAYCHVSVTNTHCPSAHDSSKTQIEPPLTMLASQAPATSTVQALTKQEDKQQQELSTAVDMEPLQLTQARSSSPIIAPSEHQKLLDSSRSTAICIGSISESVGCDTVPSLTTFGQIHTSSKNQLLDVNREPLPVLSPPSRPLSATSLNVSKAHDASGRNVQESVQSISSSETAQLHVTDLRTNQAIERSQNSSQIDTDVSHIKNTHKEVIFSEIHNLPTSHASSIIGNINKKSVKTEGPVYCSERPDNVRTGPRNFEDHLQEETRGNKSCSSDMECQIVSPPPRLPPTMITIDDSDTEDVRNLSRTMINVSVDNDDSSHPIDVVNTSNCDNQSSLSFSAVVKTPILQGQHHHLMSPLAQSISSLHVNLNPPQPLVDMVDSVTQNTSLPLTCTLPLVASTLSSSCPHADHSREANVLLSPHLKPYQHIHSMHQAHPENVGEPDVGHSQHLPRTSSPIRQMQVLHRSLLMPSDEGHTPSSNIPKPEILPKQSPPDTPKPVLEGNPPHCALPRPHPRSLLLMPDRMNVQNPTKSSSSDTSLPDTSSLPFSTFITSPPTMICTTKTSASSTSPRLSSAHAEGINNHLMLHQQPQSINSRHIMPPPMQDLPNVHLHSSNMHNNLSSASVSIRHLRRLRSPSPPSPSPSPCTPAMASINSNLAAMNNLTNALSLSSLRALPHAPPPSLRNMNQLSSSSSAMPRQQSAMMLGGSSQRTQPVKVKEENPSPHMECHLCQHLPHSPQSPLHSPHCCPYSPSPVESSPSVPPRPPPPMPPSRSPPSAISPGPPAASLMQSLYQGPRKQDQITASYLKCENVNRPSSEERPRNPAPPLIPSPSPVPNVHMNANPTTVIFSPDREIPERPPPPPPHPSTPQLSAPHIKLERHTPLQQYQCCCLRNECNRSVTRHSSDPRNLIANSQHNSSSSSLSSDETAPVAAVHTTSSTMALHQPGGGDALRRIWYYGAAAPPANVATQPGHVPLLGTTRGGTGDSAAPNEGHCQMRVLKRERLTPCVGGSQDRPHWHAADHSRSIMDAHTSASNGHFGPNTDGQESIAARLQPSALVSIGVQTEATSQCDLDDGNNSLEVGRPETRHNSKSIQTDQGSSAAVLRTHIECNSHNTSYEESPDNSSQPRRPERPKFPLPKHIVESGGILNRSKGVSHFRKKMGSSSVVQSNPFSRAHVLPSARLSPQFSNLVNNSRISSCTLEEINRLSTLEGILMKDLHELDRSAEELARRRSSLTRQLSELHQTRNNWLLQLTTDEKQSRPAHHGRRSVPVMPVLGSLEAVNLMASHSGAGSFASDNGEQAEKNHHVVDSSVSLVSSSEELSPAGHHFTSNVQTMSRECSSEGHVQKQRCTSTSNALEPRDSPVLQVQTSYQEDGNSDSDADSKPVVKADHSGVKADCGSFPQKNDKADNSLSSSVEDENQEERRITRRRSKSMSESFEDLSIDKTDDEAGATIPDTTKDETDEGTCIVENLVSTCQSEVNVNHTSNCLTFSEAPHDALSSMQLDQQTSSSGLPHKLLSQSPKSRNSSGSDHSYSLRSRGPPLVSKLKRSRLSSQCDTKEGILGDCMLSPDHSAFDTDKDSIGEDQSDDDHNVEDNGNIGCLSPASSLESLDCKTNTENQQRHKRRRRSRKHNFGSHSAYKRRKSTQGSVGSDKRQSVLSPPSRRRTVENDSVDSNPGCNSGRKPKQPGKQKRLSHSAAESEDTEQTSVILPVCLKEPVLDMKVVGDYLFLCSSSRVLCHHLCSGRAVATYIVDKANISAMAVVGIPDLDSAAGSKYAKDKDTKSEVAAALKYETSSDEKLKDSKGEARINSCSHSSATVDFNSYDDENPSKSDGWNSSTFEVVVGTSNGDVCVFSGQSGSLKEQRSVCGAVRCVAVGWGQVFVAGEPGHTYRWSVKHGGAVVGVEGCVGGVQFLLCTREGSRRVLVMGGRHSPIIVRDAFTGLFLRSLEVVQGSVLRALLLGGHLYTSGSRCIVQYQYTSGEGTRLLSTDSDVCSMTASSRYLLAACYDACVRVYCRETGALLHKLRVEPCSKLLLCSATYRHKVLLGNKAGEVVSLDLP